MDVKPSLFVILSRFPYPLEKGDKLRAFNQLKGLSSTYSITLACFSDREITDVEMQEVKQFCHEIHLFPLTKSGLFLELLRSFFSRKPFQVQYFYRLKHHHKIKQILQDLKPDHIYCQLVRVAEYVKDYHFCPKTIDYMDALSKGMERRINTEKWFKRWFYRDESKRLASYERSVFDYFEHKVIISSQDRNLILHPKNASISVIPNGVDESFFEDLNCSKTFDIVFTGNFSYAPNIEAAVFLAEKLLPALNQNGYFPTLLLSGANPTQRVSQVANKYITVSGWVDDIRVSYQSAKLFIAPLFIGTGLQNKLLEAMASGLPCVTTSLANNALQGENHKNIELAENFNEFVEKTTKFLKDKDIFNELALNGRIFVEQNYSWKTQNTLLIELFQSSSY